MWKKEEGGVHLLIRLIFSPFFSLNFYYSDDNNNKSSQIINRFGPKKGGLKSFTKFHFFENEFFLSMRSFPFRSFSFPFSFLLSPFLFLLSFLSSLSFPSLPFLPSH